MDQQFNEDLSHDKKITDMSLVSLPFQEAEPEERNKRMRDDLTSPDEPSAKHSLHDSSDGPNEQNQPAANHGFDTENISHSPSYGPPSPASTSDSVHLQEIPVAPQEKVSNSTSKHSQLRKMTYAQNVSQKPLKSFSLTEFFPEDIPLPILSSRDMLQPMLTKAVNIQLHMWQYDTQLSNVDLRFPAKYAKDLGKDHSLQCHVAHTVFQGFSKKDVHSTGRVTFPSIDLNFVDGEWNRTLEEMPFNAKEAIVPLTGDKGKVYESLPLLVKTLKPRVEQEIKFEPLPDLPKLDMSSKAMKDCLQELKLPPSFVVSYGSQSMHGKRAKEKRSKSPVTTQSSIPKTSKSTSKRKVSRQNVCTSDAVIQEALAGKATLSPYDYWGLESIHQTYRGEGTVIAVIDTGVNVVHPCLLTSWNPNDPKVIAARDFASDTCSYTVDKHGHGTHCASLACGQEFLGYTGNEKFGKVPDGVAPEAKLISCKVTPDDSGTAKVDAIARALKWLQDQKVDVVSISLGSLSFSKAIADEISDLVKQGVIIVCAASNHGHKFRQPICYPAALGNVLCIGSHDAHGKPSQFSPVGQQIHFLAPGEAIPGPNAKNYSGVQINDGTSCAAPAVAGLICLIIQCIRSTVRNEQISRQMHNHWIIKEILREMSTNSGIHFDDRGYGALNPEPFFKDPICGLKNALRESHPDLYHEISTTKKKKQ